MAMRKLIVAAVATAATCLLLAAVCGPVVAAAVVVRRQASASSPTTPPSSRDFTKLWSVPIGGTPSGVVLSRSGDMLYTAANDGYVYAVDAAVGTPVWRSPLPSPSSCTPVEVPTLGLVVVIAEDSTVTSFSAANGTAVVTTSLGQDLGAFTGCTPIWDPNSTLVFATNRLSSTLWPINVTADAISVGWSGQGPQQGWSTPTLATGGSLFVGSTEGYIYQYATASGAMTDVFSGPAVNYNRPAVVRGNGLFTCPAGFFMVEIQSQSSTWQLSSAKSSYSGILVSGEGDVFIFGTDDGRVVAVNPFEQKVTSNVSLPNGGAAVVTTPVLAGSAIVVADAFGMLYAVSPVSGAIVAATNLTTPLAAASSPAVSTKWGAVYAGIKGSIVAFAVGNGTAPPSPTPSPPTAIRIDVCYSSDCSAACHEEIFAGGGVCRPTSVGTSVSMNCTAAGLVRTSFTASGACASGTPATSTTFAVGQCYMQADGSFMSVAACPTA